MRMTMRIGARLEKRIKISYIMLRIGGFSKELEKMGSIVFMMLSNPMKIPKIMRYFAVRLVR